MDPDKATPISKYLASIDRRHSLLNKGPGLPSTPFSSDVIRGSLNFDDETFLSNDSLLQMPSPAMKRHNTSRSSSNAASFLSDMGFDQPSSRKRKSLYDDDSDRVRKKLDDMERLLRQTQIDLIDARSTGTSLEHQKNLIETLYKEKLLLAEREKNNAVATMQELQAKVQDLETRKEVLEMKEATASERFHSQQMTQTDLVSKLESRILSLQTENANLIAKHEEEMTSQTAKNEALSDQLVEMERCTEKWVCDYQSTRDQLTMVQSQFEKCQHELKEAHVKLIQAEAFKTKYEEILSSSNNNSEELKKYENLYIDEQLKNRKLETELKRTLDSNRILRLSVTSELVLKEEVASLKTHVASMEEQLKDKITCEEERNSLAQELNNWKSIAIKLNLPTISHTSLGACVRQYQNETLELKHEINTLKQELNCKTSNLLRVEEDCSKLNDQLKVARAIAEKHDLEMKRLTKKMILITKDRDSLKGLKESYEQEFGGQCPKAVQNRNQELENMISGYETLMQSDPGMFKRPCPECDETKLRIEALEVELERSRAEVKRQADSLAINRDELSKMEGIDADLSYKILSFGKNPSMMTMQEKLREVLAENERLKAQLASLNVQTTALGVNAVSTEEKKALEDKLRTLERKYEILSDSYEYETTQLQTAIERLFGYHIILSREPQSQIKLQNVNSQNPDDLFIFQAGENDWMLLETPVLDLFRAEIENYLIVGANIPGFLAIVTLKYCDGLPESVAYDSASASQKSVDTDSQLAAHHGRSGRETGEEPMSDGDEEAEVEDDRGEDSGSERSHDEYADEGEEESENEERENTWRNNQNQRRYEDLGRRDDEPRNDDDDDDEDIIMLD